MVLVYRVIRTGDVVDMHNNLSFRLRFMLLVIYRGGLEKIDAFHVFHNAKPVLAAPLHILSATIPPPPPFSPLQTFPIVVADFMRF